MSQVRIGPRLSSSSPTVLPPSEDGLPSSVDSSTGYRGCAGCPLGICFASPRPGTLYMYVSWKIVQVRSALTPNSFMANTWSCPCLLWSPHSCLDKTFLMFRFTGGAELCPVSLPTQCCPHKRHLGTKTMVFKAVQQELSIRVQCSVSTWNRGWIMY